MTDKRYKVWDSELMGMEPGEVLSAEDERNMSVMVKVGTKQPDFRDVLIRLTGAVERLVSAFEMLQLEFQADASRTQARIEQLETGRPRSYYEARHRAIDERKQNTLADKQERTSD